MSSRSILRRPIYVTLAFGAAIGLSGCVAYSEGYAGTYGGGSPYIPWGTSEPSYQGYYGQGYPPPTYQGGYGQSGYGRGGYEQQGGQGQGWQGQRAQPAVRPGGAPAAGVAPRYRQVPTGGERQPSAGSDGGPSR